MQLVKNNVPLLLTIALTITAPCTNAFTLATMSPLFAHTTTESVRVSAPIAKIHNDQSYKKINQKEDKQQRIESKSSLYKTPASPYNDNNYNDERYSASDWLHNMKTLPNSKILKEIKGPVLAVTIWSSLVSMVHQLLLRNGFTTLAKAMCLSGKPHSFLVSAIGLLLVFRTNSAYQRFTEGRKIWEKILSVSRNLSRITNLYENDLGSDRKKRVFRLISAFPYLLRHHIQPQCLNCRKKDDKINAILLPEAATDQCDDGKEVQCWVDRDSIPWSLLPNAALEKCTQSGNRPLWVCDRLSREFVNVAYTPNFTSRERLTLLSHVDKLSQSVGACERIHQTAVPLNYARHSLRSLTFWLWTLPFAVINEPLLGGWLVGPVVGAVAWVLFGVYQIGCNIEDPFQGTLRLNVMCDAVYRDVLYNENLNSRESAFSLEEEEEEWSTMEGMKEIPDLVGMTP